MLGMSGKLGKENAEDVTGGTPTRPAPQKFARFPALCLARSKCVRRSISPGTRHFEGKCNPFFFSKGSLVLHGVFLLFAVTVKADKVRCGSGVTPAWEPPREKQTGLIQVCPLA